MKDKSELPWFDFRFAPPLGLRIRYRKQFVTLIGVEAYVRRDGTATSLLLWEADDGRQGRTGLRCNSLSLKHPEPARGAA